MYNNKFEQFMMAVCSAGSAMFLVAGIFEAGCLSLLTAAVWGLAAVVKEKK